MATYAKKAYRRLEQDFQRFKREGSNKDAAPGMLLTAKLIGISQVSDMEVYSNDNRSTAAMAVTYKDGSSISIQVYDGHSEMAGIAHFKGNEAREVTKNFADFVGIPRVSHESR